MILENNDFKIIVGKNVPNTDAPIKPTEEDQRAILYSICKAVADGGFDPVSQLVGYIVSDDPTHIANYQSARTLINRIDRDELINDMVITYIKHLSSIYGTEDDES